MKINRQAMLPCPSMLCHKGYGNFSWNDKRQQWVTGGMGMLWASLCCKIARQPFLPSLPASTTWPVDGNMVQLQAVLAVWWTLVMNLPATISSVRVPVLSHKRMLLRVNRATADLFLITNSQHCDFCYLIGCIWCHRSHPWDSLECTEPISSVPSSLYSLGHDACSVYQCI